MSLRDLLFPGIVVLATVVTTACGTTPTSPTMAIAPALQTAPPDGSAGSGRSGTFGGGAATGADLQASGSASTGSPNPGATFSFTFQIKNSGPEAATAATFTDAVPAEIGYLAATVNGSGTACGFAAPVVSCDLGTLASGGQATVSISLTAPTTAGTYANTGTAASSTVDPNSGNNSVTTTVQVKASATDTIKVTKCYTNATATSGGQMLIKGASSDTTARLFAYRPDGSLIGEIQNGGGSRYGGTVMPYQPYDPVNVTIKSSSGGSITVPTTPFQL